MTATRILSTHRSRSRSISCSQIRSTTHPARRNFLKLRRSLARLSPIFFVQNGLNLYSQAGNRHPCQKSPSTKTATRARANTKSGRPGKPRTWRCGRLPAFLSARAISRSGQVFFGPILLIRADLVLGDMMSTKNEPPAAGEPPPTDSNRRSGDHILWVRSKKARSSQQGSPHNSCTAYPRKRICCKEGIPY